MGNRKLAITGILSLYISAFRFVLTNGL